MFGGRAERRQNPGKKNKGRSTLWEDLQRLHRVGTRSHLNTATAICSVVDLRRQLNYSIEDERTFQQNLFISINYASIMLPSTPWKSVISNHKLCHDKAGPTPLHPIMS